MADERPRDDHRADPENKGRYMEVHLPGEFLEECERRGVDAKEATERLMQLAVDVSREAEELFEDWMSRSNEERLTFIREGVQARMDLEFPRREE